MAEDYINKWVTGSKVNNDEFIYEPDETWDELDENIVQGIYTSKNHPVFARYKDTDDDDRLARVRKYWYDQTSDPDHEKHHPSRVKKTTRVDTLINSKDPESNLQWDEIPPHIKNNSKDIYNSLSLKLLQDEPLDFDERIRYKNNHKFMENESNNLKDKKIYTDILGDDPDDDQDLDNPDMWSSDEVNEFKNQYGKGRSHHILSGELKKI